MRPLAPVPVPLPAAEWEECEGGSESDEPLLPGRGRPEGSLGEWSRSRLLSSALALGLASCICWYFAGPSWAGLLGRSRRHEADLGTSVGFNDAKHAEAKIKTWIEVGKTYGNTHGFKVFKDTLEAFHALDNNSDGQIGFSSDNLKRLKGYVSGMDLGSFKQKIKQAQENMVVEQGPQAELMSTRYQTLKAAQALQQPLAPGPPRAMRRSTRRVVHDLYTFGAPGTTASFLYDATQEGGCMPGLRTYSTGARYTTGMGLYFEIRDPVSWITAGFNLNHAKMDAMQANDDDDKDMKNPIHACSEDRNDPGIDNFWWINGHLIYEDILRSHLDFSSETPKLWEMRAAAQGAMNLRERMNRAYLMSHFCWLNYISETPRISIDTPDWGWTLVGRACSQKRKYNLYSRPDGELPQEMADGCKDHVSLLQHNESLQCAVVFEGSDDVLDWFANLDLTLEEYCGFGPTHRGFKHKLLRMLGGVDYRQIIWPKLGSCNGLVSTGHSLGGAQAELFAACANAGLNEGEGGFEDHRYVAPMEMKPARLPPFFADGAPGFFFKNGASGLCLDVEGPMSADYEREVMLFECEMPSAGWPKEQQWQLTPDGLLVNRLGGLCLTLFYGVHGSSLRQWHCNYTSNHTDQHWDFTPERFLKNRRYSTCVDSKLRVITCPHTDQRWSFAQGHFVNALNGKCLDVFGSPGLEEGSKVVLWDCEWVNGTDQRWEFTNLGALRNTLSGLCLNVVNQQGKENTPSLALSACKPEIPKADILWDLTPAGFLKDRRSGKCVDVTGTPGLAKGSAVQLSRCEDVHIDTSGRWKLMQEGFLRNIGMDSDDKHLCVEVAGTTAEKRKEAGAALFMNACKANTDQKWELTPDGFIKNVIGGRKCLDVKPPGAPAGSSQLWLQNCEEPGDPAAYREMKWERLADGRLRSMQSLGCVTQKGLLLGQQPCAPAAAGSMLPADGSWSLTMDGLLMDPSGGNCATVVLPAGSPASLAHVGLRPCRPGLPEQRWNHTAEGFMRNSQFSSCLASAPQPAPQQPLALLWPCPETDQRWELVPGGLLRNRRTGQCLDSGLNQTALEVGQWPALGLAIWSCDSSKTSQQWELVPATS